MTLRNLVIDDLRCIERADLELHPGQNLIWGGNGSGKTSLLEAIFLLGRGRSFRTRNSERLIRYGRDRLVVFGRVASAGSAEPGGLAQSAGGSSESGAMLRESGWADEVRDGEPATSPAGRPGTERLTRQGVSLGGGTDTGEGAFLRPSGWPSETSGEPADGRSGSPASGDRVESGDFRPPPAGAVTQAVGIQVSRGDGTVARINGSSAKSLTELTHIFPVQAIDPGIHKLLEEGGHRRRRWLDWGVFHVEHQFGDWWARYARIIKQRNAALRTAPGQAAAWDPELIRLGDLIADARGRFVQALLPCWREVVVALCGLEPDLHYFKGWAQDASLSEALQSARVRDQAKGITHPGPHRADVLVRLNGRPAREVLSRGQQKLVAVAMTLAELHIVRAATQRPPTLLLDDPAAELDSAHLTRFIEQVMRLRSQLVLTSLSPESQLFGTPDRVFHVEQGRVQPGYAPRYNVPS